MHRDPPPRSDRSNAIGLCPFSVFVVEAHGRYHCIRFFAARIRILVPAWRVRHIRSCRSLSYAMAPHVRHAGARVDEILYSPEYRRMLGKGYGLGVVWRP